jgi:hypothetical protein
MKSLQFVIAFFFAFSLNAQVKVYPGTVKLDTLQFLFRGADNELKHQTLSEYSEKGKYLVVLFADLSQPTQEFPDKTPLEKGLGLVQAVSSKYAGVMNVILLQYYDEANREHLTRDSVEAVVKHNQIAWPYGFAGFSPLHSHFKINSTPLLLVFNDKKQRLMISSPDELLKLLESKK